MAGESWQKKLKYRGFRLLGFSLPILLASFAASSFIPRRPPLVLAEGQVPAAGRFILPAGVSGPVPVTLELHPSVAPVRNQKVDLQISDPEGQERLQKKIAVKTKAKFSLNFALSAAPVQTWRLESTVPGSAPLHFRLTAFSGNALTRILRFVEMLLYPALAFVLLASCMILFPSLINLQE